MEKLLYQVLWMLFCTILASAGIIIYGRIKIYLLKKKFHKDTEELRREMAELEKKISYSKPPAKTAKIFRFPSGSSF